MVLITAVSPSHIVCFHTLKGNDRFYISFINRQVSFKSKMLTKVTLYLEDIRLNRCCKETDKKEEERKNRGHIAADDTQEEKMKTIMLASCQRP